jgi:hypothetical protein
MRRRTFAASSACPRTLPTAPGFALGLALVRAALEARFAGLLHDAALLPMTEIGT